MTHNIVMRCAIFAVIILLLCNAVSCNVVKTASSSEEKKDRAEINRILDEVLVKKCKKAGVAEPRESFYKAFASMYRCIDKAYENSDNTSDSNSSETLCGFMNKNIGNCFKIAMDAVEKCLEPEEKYMPKFVTDALGNFLELVCGEKFIDLLLQPSAAKCMDDIFTDKFYDICSENPFLKAIAADGNVIFKKEELCTNLKDLHSCYDDVLTKRCSDDDVVRNLLNKVHKAVTSSCDKNDE